MPLSSTGAAAERGPAAPEPSSLGPRWSTTYEPPSEDLLAALEELVKYSTAVDVGPKGLQPAQGAVSWLPLAPMHTLLPPQVRRGGVFRGLRLKLLLESKPQRCEEGLP